jgi:ABC-type glycerol-3-phosphate transport system substrate-binding protein
MKKGTKRLGLLLLCAVLMFSFAACAGEKEPPEDTAADNEETPAAEENNEPSGTITFLSIAEYHDATVLAVEAFEAAYPDVTVDLQEYPFTQLFDVIEIKLGSQSSNFDVVLTDATMVSGYAYRGFIAPLDDYFTEDEKAVFASALVDSGTYDGAFYSPPIKNSCHVLFYNKTLLEQADVPFPSVDPAERLTWEELVPMAQQVMEAAGDPTVYGLTFEQISRPYQVLPLINSMGGEGIGPDGTTVEGYVNGEGFVNAMQWYSDIHNVDNIAPKGVAPAETVGLFASGKIAFICANIFDYRTFEDTEGLEYGYAPFPYFEDGVAATPTDSFHISVINYSENKNTAAEFVKFFTLGEGNDVFCEARGEFSARIENLNVYNEDPQYDEAPLSIFKLAAYEAQNTAYPRPKSLGYREWESVIGGTMEDIRNGADVQEALDTAVASIDAKMIPYK